MTSKILLLTLVAIFLPSIHWGEASIEFRVVCSLKGNHAKDPERVESSREILLMQKAVAAIYPRLSDELKETARQITFVVAHEPVDWSKSFLGWSSEDDLDYRYPDRKFYPQGTIKVNFGEQYVQLLDLLDRIASSSRDSEVQKTAELIAGSVIAHELLHAWQYHTSPVPDLMPRGNSSSDFCPEGLPDPQALEGTRKKVHYEKQAWDSGSSFSPKPEEIEELSRAAFKYADENPQLFKKAYSLIVPGGNIKRMLYAIRRDAIRTQKGESTFVGDTRLFYEGAYAPAEIVSELHALNGYLSQRHEECFPEITAVQERAEDLSQEWARYMQRGPLSEEIKISYPYNYKLESRYWWEIERLDERLRDYFE